jgi:hypothetical protein
VFGASVLPGVLTAVGVFTFLAGVLYLPSLSPTRMEMILALLLLAAVAMLCHLVGQVAVLIERLDGRDQRNAECGAALDRRDH